MSLKKERFSKLVLLYGSFALPMAIIGYVTTHGIHATNINVSQVKISASQDSYKVGDQVMLTIENHSSQSFYVDNHCPAEPLEVYKQSGSVWIQLHQMAKFKTCVDQDRHVLIPSNSKVPLSYKDWPGLFSEPGRYKIGLNIDGMDQQITQQLEITN